MFLGVGGILLLLVWPETQKQKCWFYFSHVFHKSWTSLQSLKPEKETTWFSLTWHLDMMPHGRDIMTWPKTYLIVDHWKSAFPNQNLEVHCNIKLQQFVLLSWGYFTALCSQQADTPFFSWLDLTHLLFAPPYCLRAGSDKMISAMSDMTWAGTTPGTWGTVPGSPCCKNLLHKKSWTSARASCQVRHPPKALEQVSFLVLSTPKWPTKRWAQWSKNSLA